MNDDDVKAKMVAVIIGTTGTSSRSFRKYLSNISGKHEIKEVKEKDSTQIRNLESTNIKCKTYVTSEITLHVAHIANTE